FLLVTEVICASSSPSQRAPILEASLSSTTASLI
ncbi:unnamed protein product, partial [Vitrella brassicaformis CCMP3155]